MGIAENKKIVEEFWSKFSICDFDGAVAMMAKDGFTWWMAGDPTRFPLAGLRTKEEFRGLLGKILEVAPGGIQVKIIGMTAEDDRVAVEAESTSKTVSGKFYANKYHFLITVRDGKVQSVKEYLDTMHTNDVFCT